nr:MAG TPA: tail collar fiber protein [Caudoviricetes sp.]
MPYDSNGLFTRMHSWEDDRKNEIDIVSDRHDEEDDNFADGLSECLLKDGRAPMKGELKMGGFQIRNMAKGTTEKDAVNKEQLDAAAKQQTELLNEVFAVGDIKASLQKSDHGSWCLCNGQAVSRTEYSDLFALIGTSFGAGDGSSTFNLPDYRGKFLRGLGGDSAQDMQTTQPEGLPNITGQTQAQDGYLRSPAASGAFQAAAAGGSARSGDGGSSAAYFTFDASRSNAIYGASSHVTPVNQAVNYFIKVKKEK